MAQHIGIVACSSEGAALCYRTICAQARENTGTYDHPEISMHTPAFSEYVQRMEAADWAGVGDLMLYSAEKLASIGAEFLICPDNTIHQALPYIEARSPLPWLHIAGVVVQEAKRRGYRRVGITGTRWLVDSDVYPEKLKAAGIDYVRPTIEQRDRCNRIIMEELTAGIFEPQGVACFQDVIGGFRLQGCDGVILGCTEIPLIISDANSPLPTLDSTRLLARAALRQTVSA